MAETIKSAEELITQEFGVETKSLDDASNEVDPKNIDVDSNEADELSQTLEKRPTISLQIINEVALRGVLLFHTKEKEGFAAIKGDGSEVYKIRSRSFRHFLSYLALTTFNKAVSSSVLGDVANALEAKSIFEGDEYNLEVRIASQGERIWYDLGNGEAIIIDNKGWYIDQHPPILFRRYHHQDKQIIPVPGGDLTKLCDFINLNSKDEKLLFLVFAVSAFIPGFPHPMLVFHGPQGSGKTTPQRLLKSLIDPSALTTISAPDSVREFVQLAAHHYFLFLDNLSSLPEWLSNSLARACTGDGFSKRELFTDDDDILYYFRRALAVNGINLVVQKADLLERSILLGLERIEKAKRREEAEFWKGFNEQKPAILGAVFDTLSKALNVYPDIKLVSHQRMADFQHWGCAIAEALGFTKEQFLKAYQDNTSKQNEEAIEASPVATCVVALMDSQSNWEGTATELFQILGKIANDQKINTNSNLWPKDPSSLSRKLNVAQTNLAEVGIQILRDRDAKSKQIQVSKVEENPDNGDTASANSQDEHKSNLSIFPEIKVKADINADNNIQPSLDGMSGLSPLPQTSNLDSLNEDQLKKQSEEISSWIENCPSSYRTSEEFQKAMTEQRQIAQMLRVFGEKEVINEK